MAGSSSPQSALLTYLNTNYPDGHADGLERDFEKKFGVSVKREGPLFQFKYLQVRAKWSERVTHECRGAIVAFDADDKKWRYRARPFDKFFNLHESNSGIHEPAVFEQRLSEHGYALKQKCDGTCIVLWYDDAVTHAWRQSTLGSITTKPLFVPREDPIVRKEKEKSGAVTFADLFCGIVARDFEKVGLDRRCTYLFELCTRRNAVVTEYADDRVYLLGIRNRDTGFYHTDTEANDVAQILGVHVPHITHSRDEKMASTKDLDDFMDREHANVGLYGRAPEGFAGYCPHTNAPTFKYKYRSYVDRHRTKSRVFTRRDVLRAVLGDYYDDIEGDLPFDLKAYKADLCKTLDEYVSTLATIKTEHADVSAGAEFAQALKRIPAGMASFYFEHKRKGPEAWQNMDGDALIQWLRAKAAKTQNPKGFEWML